LSTLLKEKEAALEEAAKIATDFDLSLQKEKVEHQKDNITFKSREAITQKECFFGTALAIKLSLAASGTHSNFSVHEMYELVKEQSIDFVEWPQWIAKQVLAQNL